MTPTNLPARWAYPYTRPQGVSVHESASPQSTGVAEPQVRGTQKRAVDKREQGAV
jgi:hypothetical protein